MRVSTTADLGALIREHRRKLGMNQATLAEEAGVSRYWIIDIESGKARADVGLVLRALRALGLSLQVTDDNPRTRRAEGKTRSSTARVRADDLIKAALRPRR